MASTSHSTDPNARRPAAGYLFGRDTSPGGSLDRQREAVEQLADARGYAVTVWHLDMGQQHNLSALLEGALAGEFEAVLAYDLSRLGRLPVHDFLNRVARPLADAGVTLVTAREGAFDLSGDLTSFIFNYFAK